MEKINGKSQEIISENIEKLKIIFPDIFTDGKIDMESLKANLGDFVESNNERYRFSWFGKNQARRIALTPTTATLRPREKDSINWESANNLFIEGDNLEVLKLLQKSYHSKVKAIYIDPPYNTGKEFVYPDNYKDNLDTYLKYTSQKDSEGFKTSTNSETGGRFHTNWLNMMYPRLKLARNLLKEDGVIFISIDDNEYANLKKICDEIFGEENFFSSVIVRANSRGQTYKQIAKTHEYILIYTKDITAELYELEKSDESNDLNLKDEIGAFSIRELRNRNPKFGKHNRPNLFYPIYINPNKEDKDGFFEVSLEKSSEFSVAIEPFNSKGIESCWRWGKPKCIENIGENTLVSNLVGKKKTDGSFGAYEKYRKTTYKPKSIWTENSFLTESGTIVTKELGFEGLFDFPKPPALVKECLKLSTKEDDIVLDFFAGSSTTAHAAIELNKEDSGHRKFIMVQLPEPCKEDTPALKAGYEKISDLSLERVKKVISDYDTKDNPLGVKVFSLDSSNIKEWDVNDNDLEGTLFEFATNIKEDRSEDDLLYEVLLKYGLDLTTPIEVKNISSNKVFSIGLGALLICFSDKVTVELVEGIAKLKDELSPEVCRVVFKDTGFIDDNVKTNAIQILKQHGVNEIKSL